MRRTRSVFALAAITAAMLTIALLTTSAPTLAQGDRAAERATAQAREAVGVLSRALEETQRGAAGRLPQISEDYSGLHDVAPGRVAQPNALGGVP